MKSGVKLFSIALASALALISTNPLWAATYTYEAIVDFSDINAGEAPYYRHNGVNALAINAAIEAYRDKFARATVAFEHDEGTYDVTITSLGEIDGDGVFRFLVNGEVVGSATNEPASEDYGEQLHKFENISIPEGAVIGVESIAVSNGTVPEGDGFAYARGRWTTLTIEDADVNPVTPDPAENVDLSVTIDATPNTVTPGEELTYTFVVENLSSFIATNPIALISLPEGLTNPVSETCVVSGARTLSCQLPELAATESATFTVNLNAATAGEKEVTVEVSSDQNDSDATNNSATKTLSVEQVAPLADNTVDLQLSISADKEQMEVGETLTYFLITTNLHDTNIATTPSIGVIVPASLQFQASEKCTIDGETIRCDLAELPPGATTTAEFTANALTVNSYSQVLATVSSDQAESNVSNNEAQTVTEISAKSPDNVIQLTEQPTETDDTTDETNGADSGGGTFYPAALLMLLIRRLYTATWYRK